MAAAVMARSSPTPPPSVDSHSMLPLATPQTASSVALNGLDSERTTPIQIPNKHMPSPNPGGVKFMCPVTPPASPPDGPQVSDIKQCMESLLHPPDGYARLSEEPTVYAIDAPGLAAAMNFTARQPLPDIEQLFPWAHGLHSENVIQLSFFFAKKKSARRVPTCYRGLCIVKVGRDYTKARLKGSILPEELLSTNPRAQGFLSVDPREGFSVRNFHIQVGKFAGLSDIVVYGDDETNENEVLVVARRISEAQEHYRMQCQGSLPRPFPLYSTFVVKSPFSDFETLFPELVAVDGKGHLTGKVVDFCHWERMEMCTMSKASEISQNVWLGSSADVPGEDIGEKWDVIIEACDLAQMPSPETLTYVLETIDRQHQDPLYLEFPGSGTISPLSWSSADVDGMVETCRFLHAIANGESVDEEELDEDGDRRMSLGQTGRPRKVLVHCADGYTETSLLALAYIIYAETIPVHEAWVKLHTVKNRNFFAYDKDLAFLRYVEHKLLSAAARDRKLVLDGLELGPPGWLYRMDGSLPSRILPYMYLGNLLHANNCGLLQAIGIKRVLSIGEDLSWTEEEKNVFGKHRVMMVKDLQDNGCDPLEYQFRSCLEFIDEGHRLDEPILVHCRVGVSRSATICIAEVMRSLNLSLPRAYCYVRARRLNVIIQPHLRFMYELLKFEESLVQESGSTPKRELEWAHVAREIAAMNRPYIRQP